MFDEQVVPRLRDLAPRLAGDRPPRSTSSAGQSRYRGQALDRRQGQVPRVGSRSPRQPSASASSALQGHRGRGPCPDRGHDRGDDLPSGSASSRIAEGTEDVVDALVRELKRTGTTLAVAELHRGMIAQQIRGIAGVSDVFMGAVVSYASSARWCWACRPISSRHRAVSGEVAGYGSRGPRAIGGRRRAVPSRGSPGRRGGRPKPVGLVYVGLARGGLRVGRSDFDASGPTSRARSSAPRRPSSP